MEFALLIWAIGALPGLTVFLALSLLLVLLYLFIYYGMWGEGSLEDGKHRTWAMLLGVLISILLVITPSTKTAYMMVGAYAAQRVVEAPETKQITSKIIAIVNDKLDQELQRK